MKLLIDFTKINEKVCEMVWMVIIVPNIAFIVYGLEVVRCTYNKYFKFNLYNYGNRMDAGLSVELLLDFNFRFKKYKNSYIVAVGEFFIS